MVLQEGMRWMRTTSCLGRRRSGKGGLSFPSKDNILLNIKIEIHIDNIEIENIIEVLKEQGVDVTRAEVESHIEDYIFGAIEDSRYERMDTIVDSIIDLQA